MNRLLVPITCVLTTLFAYAVAAPPAPTHTKKSKNTPDQTEAAKAPAKPLVKKIATNIYQIGKVTINKKTREISFPTQTNALVEGTLLEFLLVHFNGEKAHESLLITKVDPTHLNIAFKLLDYKESQELFRAIKDDGSREELYQKEPDDIRNAARFTVHVTWKIEGKEKTHPITQWVKSSTSTKSMPQAPFVYNGSYIHNQKFIAKLNGNIFAILPNESALATYLGTEKIDRYDDTLWLSASGVPDETTVVTVTLKPWTGKLQPQKLK